MSMEKRKVPRRHIIYYLQVSDRTTVEMIGHLVDITTIGMMLITEQPLESGKKYTLRVSLPSEFTQAEYLDVAGECVWIHKDVNPDYYAVGFKLDEAATGEQSALITDLIDALGFFD